MADILKFGLKEGFLIEVLLLPQVLQRLDDEHSHLLAPYKFNSADLMKELGYSAKVLEEGFNTKNKYERTAPFHGETLKHVLLSTKADKLLDWFNNDWNQLMKSNVPGRTRQYIIDGTKIIVPRHLYESFEGAGLVKNKESALLLMDRKIDICMPLRRNSEITQFELALAERYNCWGPHPTHKNQKI